MHRRCLIVALLAVGLSGCFGDTAVLLQMVLPARMDVPEFVTISITAAGGGVATPIIEVEQPFDDLYVTVEGEVTRGELALTPGTVISEGDVSIRVAVASSGEIRATGSVTARLEPHRVNEAIVNLTLMPCVDDPFESADAVGGAVISDLVYPVLPNLTLCADDDHDDFWALVPQGWSVLYGLQETSPNQALQAIFVCIDATGTVVQDGPMPIQIGPLPLATAGGALGWSVLPENASCGVHVERLDEPGAEPSTASYLLTLSVVDFDLETVCASPPPPVLPINLTASDNECIAPRTLCGMPDVFQVDVARGMLLRAAVTPEDMARDPEDFSVTVECPGVSPPGVPGGYDPAIGAGLAISRTGPATTGAVDRCTITVDGTPGTSFQLCLDVGDYTDCVDDRIDAPGAAEPFPLNLFEPAQPFAVCDDGDGTIAPTGEVPGDDFVFPVANAFIVCVEAFHPQISGNEGDLMIVLESAATGSVEFSVEKFGSVLACMIPDPTMPISGDMLATVACASVNWAVDASGCGNAYAIEATAF